MTDQTLATYSNLSIYSAMAVLTLAMILYAVHLARLMPSKEREPKRELVPVGAEVGAVGTDAGVGIAAGDSASHRLRLGQSRRGSLGRAGWRTQGRGYGLDADPAGHRVGRAGRSLASG